MCNVDRPATCCDCFADITQTRGATLKAAGYKIVGSYLDEIVSPSSPNYLGRALILTKLQTILDSGLHFFPIFQYGGKDASSFTYDIALSHASIAHDKAAGFRITAGTYIYSAVD
ncbi:hypothetical protein GQ53DRAFT_763137 [Thozetella sp. PMI_491]|nr:hypothetical protein GQ53DRAFT_763137 [Thozetella sp. PMI_491]